MSTYFLSVLCFCGKFLVLDAILFMYADGYSLNGINKFHPFQLKQCQKIIKFLLTANFELKSESRKQFNDLF